MSHRNQSPCSRRATIAEEKEDPYIVSFLIRWKKVKTLIYSFSLLPSLLHEAVPYILHWALRQHLISLLLQFVPHLSFAVYVHQRKLSVRTVRANLPLQFSSDKAVPSAAAESVPAGLCTFFSAGTNGWQTDKVQRPLLFILTFFCHFCDFSKKVLTVLGLFFFSVKLNIFRFLSLLCYNARPDSWFSMLRAVGTM